MKTATKNVKKPAPKTAKAAPKKAMPKPSLCSCARVASPAKLNITSVGVLAFMPSNWHIGAGVFCRWRAAPVCGRRGQCGR